MSQKSIYYGVCIYIYIYIKNTVFCTYSSFFKMFSILKHLELSFDTRKFPRLQSIPQVNSLNCLPKLFLKTRSHYPSESRIAILFSFLEFHMFISLSCTCFLNLARALCQLHVLRVVLSYPLSSNTADVKVTFGLEIRTYYLMEFLFQSTQNQYSVT